MVDYSRFDALTFDCYGTLIDWEAGILAALRAALGDAVSSASDTDLLAAFARYEHAAEEPGRHYRQVLALTLDGIADEYGLTATADQRAGFAGSVVDWPAFPDSSEALHLLHARFKLAVITNCDEDLFAASAERLGVHFDHVFTAETIGSYKPDQRNFHHAHERLRAAGIATDRILHVAQSLYHDHVPAKHLGMTTVWINRQAGRSGATPPADATPDATFPDMRSFADAALETR